MKTQLQLKPLQAWHQSVPFADHAILRLYGRREWFGIDKLRMDKFMMLVRTFIAHLFQHLGDNDWYAPPCPAGMRTNMTHKQAGQVRGVVFDDLSRVA